MKYLDENGLLYLIQKIKTWLNGKVDKVTGKGLSTNDYTTEEKNKLARLENYNLPTASADTLGGVKVGAGLSITNGVLSATGGGTADAVEWNNVLNKPTKVSEFTNDAGYQNSTQVQTLINNSIADIQGISYEVVSALPSTGEAGVIYLVTNSKTETQNIYDEYIWASNKFEKIGTTAVDLTNYVEFDDLVAITNAEIDTIVAS